VIPGPVRVLREGELLVRRSGRQPRPSAFRHEIAPGAAVDGPDGAWHLRLSAVRARSPLDPDVGSPLSACFDADALVFPLIVRSPVPGDRIAVPSVGTRKLQDVFVDAKVARERRKTAPVVTDAQGRVLWIAGVVRGAGALVTPSTRRVLDGRLE